MWIFLNNPTLSRWEVAADNSNTIDTKEIDLKIIKAFIRWPLDLNFYGSIFLEWFSTPAYLTFKLFAGKTCLSHLTSFTKYQNIFSIPAINYQLKECQKKMLCAIKFSLRFIFQRIKFFIRNKCRWTRAHAKNKNIWAIIYWFKKELPSVGSGWSSSQTILRRSFR